MTIADGSCYTIIKSFGKGTDTMGKIKRVICDCDNTANIPGRPMDDALALLYLLGSSEDIDLIGITCNYGNGTSAESFATNTSMMKETGYTRIPVLHGFEQGESPVCESSRFIAEMAEKYQGELVYLGIGSLGNLYGAYLIDNDIFEKIGQIVLMGGITEPLIIHDSQPLAELNFSINPEASETVLCKGRNITIITGNNCLPVSALPKDEFLDKLCSSDNPAGMYIAKKCGYRFKTKEVVYGADSSYCWDAVAAAYINHPEKFTDSLTPCLINYKDINERGYLHPCDASEAVNMINIPEARSRVEIQELFYSSWLALDMHTSDANFSCKGLYLDKLIQPCVLIELSKEPCHGFSLMQKLKTLGYIEDSLDPAGFYRTLKRMEKDGYLSSSAETDGQRAKRIYSITDLGKRALVNWEDSLRKYENHISRIVSAISSIKS